MKEPVIIVEVFEEIVDEINKVFSSFVVKYIYGRQTQILKSLQDLNNSSTLQSTKYPLIALFQDFPENRGRGYYADLSIPKIIIATLTNKDDFPKVRYSKTFKPVLYPIYYEFLHQLSKHKNVVTQDEDNIPHQKWDRVGTLPMGSDLADYVDAIEINNLSFNLQQSKICKNGTEKSL